jgi:hypothetical protein
MIYQYHFRLAFFGANQNICWMWIAMDETRKEDLGIEDGGNQPGDIANKTKPMVSTKVQKRYILQLKLYLTFF